MANLNVTYDQMQSAATRLRNFTTSRASGAFDTAYQEFTQGATRTIQGIDGMADYLNKAAQALQQTDEQLAQSIGK